MSGPAAPKAKQAVSPRPLHAASRDEGDVVANGTWLGIDGLLDLKSLQVRFEQSLLPLARSLGVTCPGIGSSPKLSPWPGFWQGRLQNQLPSGLNL